MAYAMTLNAAIKDNKEYLKELIKKYEEELNDKNFDFIYTRLTDYSQVRSFTALLLKNNINPLEYIDELPNYFAAELDIKKIIIPNGFINIPEGAFSDCSKLESIYIPKSVIDIGWAAFAGCNNLKDVYYEGTQEEWERIYIEESYLDEGDDNDALLNANIHYNI